MTSRFGRGTVPFSLRENRDSPRAILRPRLSGRDPLGEAPKSHPAEFGFETCLPGIEFSVPWRLDLCHGNEMLVDRGVQLVFGDIGILGEHAELRGLDR